MYAATSFTSATTGNAISARTCLVGITGTFSATVKLKWVDASGTVHTVQESGADLSFTAAGERVVEFGVPVKVYPECTAFTSGTAVVCLTGSITGTETSGQQ
jgi:hypothetical protein